jgi:hypothetical protein
MRQTTRSSENGAIGVADPAMDERRAIKALLRP